MVLTDLRKIAESYLCKSCYDKYVGIIEPTIKSFILNPFLDWRTVEMCITQMFMKSKGVYKSDELLISIADDSDALGEKVDLERFRRLKRRGFKEKIKYLYKKEILPKSVYIVLCNISSIRNNIHEYIHKFSEQDLLLFKQASEITFLLFQSYVLKSPKELELSLKMEAEKYAEKLLKKHDWK